MNKFLFITTTSPKSFEKETLRNKLFNLFLKTIHKINYPHVDFYIVKPIDEKINVTKDNIKIFDSEKNTKGEKLIEIFEFLKSSDKKYDYVSRLDDDDLLSTKTLYHFSTSKADLIMDKYHSFLDITSGRISQQKRPWVPNTALHKFEHAMKLVDENDTSGLLFGHSHSKKWRVYYEGKNVAYSSKRSPIYLRILNPMSITAISHNQKNAINAAALDYFNYLNRFGHFKVRQLPDGFRELDSDVANIISALNYERNKRWNENTFIRRLWKKIYHHI